MCLRGCAARKGVTVAGGQRWGEGSGGERVVTAEGVYGPEIATLALLTAHLDIFVAHIILVVIVVLIVRLVLIIIDLLLHYAILLKAEIVQPPEHFLDFHYYLLCIPLDLGVSKPLKIFQCGFRESSWGS